MEPSEITEKSLDLQALAKSPEAHKYSHGHALVLTGGPGKTGAARLAARGALRIGAGLVTLGCPHAALNEIAVQSTAIMCRPLDGAPGLAEALEDPRLNALCLGPGLGLGPDTQALVLAALKAERATVLDADALTRFQRNPEVLFGALHPNSLLTPHDGEFTRLFPDLADAIRGEERAGALKTAAARAGCTILLKGTITHIASETGEAVCVKATGEAAAPWLATAGSGDVLAGFATGLMARGFQPLKAAGTAAWLHTAAARHFGPGLIAEDLPEALPSVFRDLDLFHIKDHLTERTGAPT
ncbi:MAG: NAD(P)H-hydrate dehydratase [Boseongicola sp.]|nr:NAD(P)H-hydrate dehydratase [Boseongicola sp.]